MYVKIEQENNKPPIENERNQQMHFSETNAGVPAFLAKLWRLVDDPETNSLICWSKDGRSFIIQNQAQFARELLPLNYKHNNMASFIRQLNMYGFHKITSIDNGGLKFDRDEMEFTHPYFKRNCSYLLEHIKRKISNTKSHEEKATVKPEAVTKVLQDVKAMRGRQDSLDSRFNVMKQENEALWREIASLRQKHAKQQQIVNKLIQFLITIVQPSRNMSGVKRHMQLMINDAPETSFRNASESESECGPVIHELGGELLEEAAGTEETDLMDPVSPFTRSYTAQADGESLSPLNVERPQSSTSISSQHYDYSNQSFEDALGGNTLATNFANQRNISPNLNGAAAFIVNGSSVEQSISQDGIQIVYHVTEVPDAHPNEQDTNTAAQKVVAVSNEENVLTTPMVRKQMARTQILKEKNKQRREQSDQAAAAYKLNAGNSVRISQKEQQTPVNMEAVKVEPNDPMLFLNTFDDNRRMTPDPRLYSPNFNEDSTQSINGAIKLAMAGQSISPRPPPNENAAQLTNRTSPPNLYNAGDFMNENIPNELFDDSSILSTGIEDNSNFSGHFKINETQHYGQPSARNGKFSDYVADNNSNAGSNNTKNTKNDKNNVNNNTPTLGLVSSMPSTSAAAAASSTLVGNNMTVAKYQKAAGNENILPLSTAEEVNGHLENVQDELESLKELLRSDGYSFDASTLMNLGLEETANQNNNNAMYTLDTELLNKLFNDSDVLGPYGLGIVNPDLPININKNDKKGSEVMAYQPDYDLSDILDKSPLEADTNSPSTPLRLTTSNPSPASSTLNTPYHE